MFDINVAREQAEEQFETATGRLPSRAELNYMTACAEGTEEMYNTAKYGCLADYLQAVDTYIDAERERNGISSEEFGNTPTKEEMLYFGKPDGYQPQVA